jgi:hypothetical protein
MILIKFDKGNVGHVDYVAVSVSLHPTCKGVQRGQ